MPTPEGSFVLVAQLFDHMMFSDEGDYYPLVHFDEFWLLRDKLVMINETVSNLTLHLELKPISFWWWQLQLQVGAPGPCGAHACLLQAMHPLLLCTVCGSMRLAKLLWCVHVEPEQHEAQDVQCSSACASPNAHALHASADRAVLQDAGQHRPAARRRVGRV